MKDAVGTIGPSGTLRPLPIAAPAGSRSTPTIFTGTFSLKLTVSVLSPVIPTSTPIHCTLLAGVVGFATSPPIVELDGITDSSVVAATRSGSKATCTVLLPYKWALFGSNDTVTLTYQVDATSSSGVGRVISVFIETIPVPASGTTTSLTETGAI
jgi:hypothetical protein